MVISSGPKNSSTSARSSPTNSFDDSRPRRGTYHGSGESIWRYNLRNRSTLNSKGKDPIFEDVSTKLHKLHLKSRTDSNKEEFDFMRARNMAKSTSLKGGIAMLVKGCLGSGVLIVHASYNNCGLWTALLLTMFLGTLISYCMHELVRAAQKMYKIVKVSTMTYPDLAEASLELGPWKRLSGRSRCFRHLVEILTCLHNFGTCALEQVIIGRALKQLASGGVHCDLQHRPGDVHLGHYHKGDEHNYKPSLSRRGFIATTIVPCAMIAVLTNLKHVAPFSIVADFGIGITALSTVYYGSMAAGKVTPMQKSFLNSTLGMFAASGMLLYAMNGIDSSLAVENSIRNPQDFPLVVAGGMTIVTIVIMIYGFFGCWGFGKLSVSPITLNFPWFPFAITVKMFMIIVVYLTYPLYFYVPFHQVWYYLSSCHNRERHWIWERVYRVLFSIFCSLCAIGISSATHLCGLLGGLTLSLLGFVFPVFISLSLDWQDLGPGKFYWRVWKTVAIILFGLTLGVCATVANGIFVAKYIKYI